MLGTAISEEEAKRRRHHGFMHSIRKFMKKGDEDEEIEPEVAKHHGERRQRRVRFTKPPGEDHATDRGAARPIRPLAERRHSMPMASVPMIPVAPVLSPAHSQWAHHRRQDNDPGPPPPPVPRAAPDRAPPATRFRSLGDVVPQMIPVAAEPNSPAEPSRLHRRSSQVDEGIPPPPPRRRNTSDWTANLEESSEAGRREGWEGRCNQMPTNQKRHTVKESSEESDQHQDLATATMRVKVPRRLESLHRTRPADTEHDAPVQAYGATNVATNQRSEKYQDVPGTRNGDSVLRRPAKSQRLSGETIVNPVGGAATRTDFLQAHRQQSVRAPQITAIITGALATISAAVNVRAFQLIAYDATGSQHFLIHESRLGSVLQALSQINAGCAAPSHVVETKQPQLIVQGATLDGRYHCVSIRRPHDLWGTEYRFAHMTLDDTARQKYAADLRRLKLM